eukprot:2791361-Amphidinium_carterae.1
MDWHRGVPLREQLHEFHPTTFGCDLAAGCSAWACNAIEVAQRGLCTEKPVSYTHLTLPTILLV